MKTELKNGRLIIKDQPWVFWAFYSLFLMGGLVAVVFSLVSAADRMTAVIVTAIGIGNMAGGLYMIRKQPASVVVFDRGADEVCIRRWYPVGKKEERHLISALSSVEVEITEHTDGGPVYRPQLGIRQSEFVPISMFWYQSMKESEEVVSEIKRYVKIAPNVADAGDSQ